MFRSDVVKKRTMLYGNFFLVFFIGPPLHGLFEGGSISFFKNDSYGRKDIVTLGCRVPLKTPAILRMRLDSVRQHKDSVARSATEKCIFQGNPCVRSACRCVWKNVEVPLRMTTQGHNAATALIFLSTRQRGKKSKSQIAESCEEEG